MPSATALSDSSAPTASEVPVVRTVTPADASATATGSLAGEAPRSTMAQPTPAQRTPAQPTFTQPEAVQQRGARRSGGSVREPPQSWGSPPARQSAGPNTGSLGPGLETWARQAQWKAQRDYSNRRGGTNWGVWLVVGVAVVIVLSAIGGLSGGQMINSAGDTPYEFGNPVPVRQVAPEETFAPAVFPSTDPLVAVGGLTRARTHHTATLLPDGRVVVVGGISVVGGSSTALTLIETYDPTTRSFSRTGDLLTARSDHTATLLRDGTVLIAGGKTSDGTALGSAEVYDPRTGESRATGALASATYSASAVALDDGSVFVVGGYGDNDISVGAEIYDPSSGTFGPVGPPNGAGLVTAVKLNDGRVLVSGGLLSGESLDSAEVFDPTTNQFDSTGGMSEARAGATSCLLDDGRVLVVGGGNLWQVPSSTAEIYDPAEGDFIKVAQLDDVRSQGTATVLADDSVLMVGGVDGTRSPIATIERFDPATGVSTPVGTMAESRAGQTATRLADGSVLIVGGSISAKAVTADAAVYDPSAPPVASASPSPDASAASSASSMQSVVPSSTPPASPS
jgi:hypothetical protein